MGTKPGRERTKPVWMKGVEELGGGRKLPGGVWRPQAATSPPCASWAADTQLFPSHRVPKVPREEASPQGEVAHGMSSVTRCNTDVQFMSRLLENLALWIP